MPHRLSTTALIVVTVLGTLFITPPTAKASDLLTVAQSTQQQQQSNTGYSSRGTRKLVKLGILGLCGVIAVGGWAVKKVRGSNS